MSDFLTMSIVSSFKSNFRFSSSCGCIPFLSLWINKSKNINAAKIALNTGYVKTFEHFLKIPEIKLK